MDIEKIFKSEEVARLLDRFHHSDRYRAMEIIAEAMEIGIREYRKEHNNESNFKHVGYQYKENGTWYPATLLQHTIEGNGREIRKVYAEVNE